MLPSAAPVPPNAPPAPLPRRSVVVRSVERVLYHLGLRGGKEVLVLLGAVAALLAVVAVAWKMLVR